MVLILLCVYLWVLLTAACYLWARPASRFSDAKLLCRSILMPVFFPIALIGRGANALTR